MPPTTSQAATQGAFEVAQRSRLPQGAACGQPPLQRRRERLANIHPRAAKKATLGISPRYTAHHRSVGRLSALYHRLLLQLCKLRHNSPPQDRLHRSKVATLAGQTPNIPHRQLLELFIRLPSILCSPSKWLTITTCKAGVTLSNPPLANRLGEFADHPRHK